MRISVIIPAHNEAAVIARCLGTLLDGAPAGVVEVIVVCNGCTDDTARIAGTFGPSVRVIETTVASKTNAINLGDAAAGSFPRFVVDADVVIAWPDLSRLARELESGSVLAVAPKFRMDLAGCSWVVRAFWRITDLLPSSEEGIGGSGVYGLSAAGRERFARFPDVVADDAFVRIQFKEHERETLSDCRSTVFSPRRLRELLAITTRAHLGNAELRDRFPAEFVNIGTSNHAALLSLWLRPWLWPSVAVYTLVKLIARARVRRARSGRADSHRRWERDATARSAAEPITAVVE